MRQSWLPRSACLWGLLALVVRPTVPNAIVDGTRDSVITSRRALFALFALVVAAAWLMQGAGYNQNSHYALVKALASGTPMIDQTRFEVGDLGTQDLAYKGGHYYSDKPPGLAMVGLPAYVVLKALGVRTSGDPTTMLWALGLVGVVLPTALLLFLVAIVVETLERGLGAVTAILVGAGTLLLPFETMFFAHALSAFLIFVSFAALFFSRQRGGLALVVVGGILAGCAVTTEYPNLMAATALGFYALAGQPRLRRALAYAGGALVGVVPLLAYQAWAFGSPFETARSHALYFRGENATQRAGEHAGVLGFDTLPSLRRGIWLLFSEWGLLTATPVVLIALIALVALARRGWRAEAVLIGALWFIYLLINSSYYSIFGDFAGGPRYLVPVLPLLALPLATAARRWPGETAGLAAASIACMVGLTVTRPLFAAEGSVLERLRERQFPPTAASLLSFTGSSAAILFLVGVGAAVLAALASVSPRGLRMEHVACAAVAFGAWAAVRTFALQLLPADARLTVPEALAVVLLAAIAVGSVVLAHSAVLGAWPLRPSPDGSARR